jgi:hypothetical protein
MLSSLISNKSAEKILFYLLLNSKCYATQLSQRLETPLTPLQHALQKLEDGGVLISHSEGKTRHFEFNPNYPLLHELEVLLKKAYTYLPIQQKKLYYSPQFSNVAQNKNNSSPAGPLTSRAAIFGLWEKLRDIKTMTFSAKSKSVSGISGWNGIGKGNVEVKIEEGNTLIFHERGSWNSEENKRFDFSNVFRWTLKADDGAITLEHLRFGNQNPVFLFSLIPTDSHTLESLESHTCNQDSYFGQLRCDKHFIQFNWRIIGPKKNEEIDYLYT